MHACTTDLQFKKSSKLLRIFISMLLTLLDVAQRTVAAVFQVDGVIELWMHVDGMLFILQPIWWVKLSFATEYMYRVIFFVISNNNHDSQSYWHHEFFFLFLISMRLFNSTYRSFLVGRHRARPVWWWSSAASARAARTSQPTCCRPGDVG